MIVLVFKVQSLPLRDASTQQDCDVGLTQAFNLIVNLMIRGKGRPFPYGGW